MSKRMGRSNHLHSSHQLYSISDLIATKEMCHVERGNQKRGASEDITISEECQSRRAFQQCSAYVQMKVTCMEYKQLHICSQSLPVLKNDALKSDQHTDFNKFNN